MLCANSLLPNGAEEHAILEIFPTTISFEGRNISMNEPSDCFLLFGANCCHLTKSDCFQRFIHASLLVRVLNLLMIFSAISGKLGWSVTETDPSSLKGRCQGILSEDH